MIQIPAGPFVFSGPGEPPSPYQRELAERKVERTAEQTIDVPTYWIDRTEVTNAAFAVFSSMGGATGIVHPKYPPSHELMDAGDAQHPVAGLTWHEATAYCAFLGKRLPSSEQWQKALRGGLQLNGRDNPQPRRNFPWGTTQSPRQASLNDETPKGPRPVGSFATDQSPYGVVDLAGNVAEWIRSDLAMSGSRMTRGGNWSETPADDLVNFMPIENARAGDTRTFTIGMRCADEP
jgi:formylglycine-generating enzyme required for sulfatase activity